MTDSDQFEFTVSPYDEDVPPEESIAPARRFSALAAVPAVLLLGAAALAAAANFADVYRLRFTEQGGDGLDPVSITLSFNGWGQHHYVSSIRNDPDASGVTPGAQWGWLFAGCAAVLLVAAIWVALPRLRTRLLGPAEVALAAVFAIAGGVAALVLSFAPDQRQFAGKDSHISYRWGWFWPLELTAAALGLIGWLWYRWLNSDSGRPEPVAEVEDYVEFRTWDGVEPADATHRQTGNWFDEARDRPGTPTDPDRSPW